MAVLGGLTHKPGRRSHPVFREIAGRLQKHNVSDDADGQSAKKPDAGCEPYQTYLVATR